jgi:hypothetical protein
VKSERVYQLVECVFFFTWSPGKVSNKFSFPGTSINLELYQNYFFDIKLFLYHVPRPLW